MKNVCILFTLVALMMTACIGDDFIFDTVEESVRISANIDSLAIGDTYQFEAVFTNNIGLEEMREIVWSSSDEDILIIDQQGLATGISKGQCSVRAEVVLSDTIVSDSRIIYVADTTVISGPDVRTGMLRSTSSYLLEGMFILSDEGDHLTLAFDESYRASTALPGLYLYLTNNPNSTNGAFEIGEVQIFNGEHDYQLSKDEVAIDQYSYVLYYCKPFNVKVGDGQFDE